MVKQISAQNNFIAGLKTEFTGLNFPEDAATESDNCVYSLIGEVQRRSGINYEAGFELQSLSTNAAVSYGRWRNAGGDGVNDVLVLQMGGTLNFFLTSAATSSISTQLLASTVTISTYQAMGNTNDVTQTECQYAFGNGYLFVFHPDCDPFYCTYNSGTILANVIPVDIRDFTGVTDNLAINTRPATLSADHQYNLQNQGWTSPPSFSASLSSNTDFPNNTVFPQGGWLGTLPVVFTVTVPAGLTFSPAETVSLNLNNWMPVGPGGNGSYTASGTITSYTGTTMVINIIAFSGGGPISSYNFGGHTFSTLVITTTNTGQITTWFGDLGNYPSNADQWWVFKDSSGVYDPSTTVNQITLNTGQAPQGHYTFSAFNQNRSSVSGINGLTTVSTTLRPRTGCWFQGRVFYAGVDASQAAAGDAQFYTWTENIYFSTIVTQPTDFGQCYQTNDPTSENLSDILASDGGVIVIQGSGAIYRLFPVQNGLLVFARNGVWFITGSQGIGFTAVDYTITKISEVQCISSYSFVNVLGYPIFWNEEGIYRVMPSQSGLDVTPITIDTIRTFYVDIPLISRYYARGDYDPVNYVVKWVYRSTAETNITNRYQFDSVLNLRLVGPRGPEMAFYPYSIENTNPAIAGVVYMNYPTGLLDPTIKYLTTVGSQVTFSEENDDTNWVDFIDFNGIGFDFDSSFTAGYSLAGKSVMKWQPTYVMVYSDNSIPTQYTIQGVWDFATTGNSGKYSTNQWTTNWNPNFGFLRRRYKIRGHGEALQLKFASLSGKPFNIIGWSVLQEVEQGV